MKCARPECKEDFEPYSRLHRCCSALCSQRLRHARIKAERPPQPPLAQRRCRCGCGRRFTPTRGYQTYATYECGHRAHGRIRKAERPARRETKHERHPNTRFIWELRREMDAEGKAELCIYCEKPLTTGVLICDRRGDCETLYNADYKRGMAYNKRETKEARAA